MGFAREHRHPCLRPARVLLDAGTGGGGETADAPAAFWAGGSPGVGTGKGALPGAFHTLSHGALLTNVSRQGARLSKVPPLAPGTPVTLVVPPLAPLRAEVRWARALHLGLRFAAPLDPDQLDRLRQSVGLPDPTHDPDLDPPEPPRMM